MTFKKDQKKVTSCLLWSNPCVPVELPRDFMVLLGDFFLCWISESRGYSLAVEISVSSWVILLRSRKSCFWHSRIMWSMKFLKPDQDDKITSISSLINRFSIFFFFLFIQLLRKHLFNLHHYYKHHKPLPKTGKTICGDYQT